MSSTHPHSRHHDHPADPAERPVESDLRQSILEVERALSALASAAKRAFGEGVCSTCRRAEELNDQGRVRLTELGTEASRYVAAKPVRSLIGAALAGFFLGAIWSRRGS
jgi:ElaB/YqjD/DUF883 family membrane-anchored ribosome-binding protein